MRTLLHVSSLLASALLLGACANAPPQDKLAPYNRSMFAVNEGIDRYAIEPIATGWDFVLPEPVQDSVANVFDNFDLPVVFLNDLLQGKFADAGHDFWRFSINLTFGVVGIFDAATHAGVPDNDEDFGQTLGAWGVPAGPYFVLPLFGPSNIRDTAALPVDWFSNPMTWILGFWPRVGLRSVDAINDRAAFLEEIRENRETSLDYYVFVRNAWTQNRERRVRDGASILENEAQDDLYQFDDE